MDSGMDKSQEIYLHNIKVLIQHRKEAAVNDVNYLNKDQRNMELLKLPKSEDVDLPKMLQGINNSEQRHLG